MTVYYNEIDFHAAVWLRNLIDAGELPKGDVDTRSIVEVKKLDLNGYTQHHFFAGIGGWPLALRLAGWPEDKPVWTGSCPCQPFSNAGKRKGTEDSRHLWPEFQRLIDECRPISIFGEQVASKAGRVWLSGVRADLEALGYAVGGADLCAAGIGAPHIRQRLFWVGNSNRTGLERWREQIRQDADQQSSWQASPCVCRQTSFGFWNNHEFIECADGKTRRIEPEVCPLAYGLPEAMDGFGTETASKAPINRKGVLTGFGNAIVPPLAAEFILTVMDLRL